MSYRAISIIIPQNPNFIDGTVEGTDITQYGDPVANHNHTYHGNGCPNRYDSSLPYNGGSIVACSTNIVETADGERLAQGTYYNLNASTVDSGYNALDNMIISDSFCPLGWQLPYSGTGGDYYDKSKSWRYLFETTYSLTSSAAGSQAIRSYPISFILAGRIEGEGGTGVLYQQGSIGSYWSLTGTHYGIVMYLSSYNVANHYSPRSGQALRCDKHFSIKRIALVHAGTFYQANACQILYLCYTENKESGRDLHTLPA